MNTFHLANRIIKQGYEIDLVKENLYSYVVKVSKDGVHSIVTLDKFIAIGYEYETVKESLQIAYDEINQKKEV